MSNFDAVSIEHTLANFFGNEVRGPEDFYSADKFRAGNPKDLAKIVSRVANHLEQRLVKIRFPASGEGHDGAKAQLEGAISRLRALAERVKERSNNEREDYHWEIFGALMMAMDGLLERLEA